MSEFNPAADTSADLLTLFETAVAGRVGVRLTFLKKDRAEAAATRLLPSYRLAWPKVSTDLVYLFPMADADRLKVIVEAMQDDGDKSAFVYFDVVRPDDDYQLDATDAAYLVEYKTFGDDVTVEEFEAAFPPVGLGLSSDRETVTTLNDAEVHGSLSDDVLNTPVQIAVAAKADEKKFTVSKIVTFEQFLNSDITKIRVGKKDGKCFVLGALMDGRRVNPAVTKLYMLGLDVDSGPDMMETIAKGRAKNLMFIAYTTHSHGTTRLEIKKDRFHKWADDNGHPTEPSTEGVKLFLTDEAKYTADVIASAEYVETVHESTGIQIVVRTRPIDKFRLVFLLDTPYVIAEQKMSQKEAIVQWGDMILGMGAALGIKVDRAARDCSRLFYLPSRDAKATNAKIVINAGNKLDWTTIKKVSIREHNDIADSDPYGQAGAVMGGNVRGRAVSPQKGLDLQQWARETAHGFQISEVFKDHCDDRLREETAPGKFTCECPFDSDHSNAGDPDDKGCFIHDAGSDAQTFAFRCSHDSCSGRDRLDMLQQAMKEGWFTDDVLTDPQYNIAVADETEGDDDDATDEDGGTDEDAIAADPATRFLGLDALIKKATAEKASANIVSGPTMEALVDCVAREPNRVSAIDRIRGLKLTTITEFREAVKKRAKKHANSRPLGEGKVYSDMDLRQIVPIVTKALRDRNTPPYMFNFGRNLVRVVDGPRVSVETMDEDALRFEATEAIDYREVRADEDVGKRMSKDIVQHLMAAPDKTFAEDLRRIAFTPLVAPDGTATMPYDFDEWYFDQTLKALIDPRGLKGMPVVKQKPLAADVKLAVRILDKLLDEWGYSDDPTGGIDGGKSSRANALGLLLVQFVRDFHDDPTPLFLIDKGKPGAGATFLAMVAYQIAYGTNAPVATLPTNEDELRKATTTDAKDGVTFKLWDNIKRRIDSAFLASTLTSRTYTDRILGGNTSYSGPNLMTHVGTGENMTMSDEIARRVVYIRLETGLPSNDRRKFKRANPMSDLLRMRGVIVWALLTLVTNWVASGKKKARLNFPSYDEFAGVVGGVLEAAGIEGFLNNREAFLDAKKTDNRHVVALMEALLRRFALKPFTAAEAVPTVFDDAGLGGALFSGLGITAHNDNTAKKAEELESRFAKRVGTYELLGATYQFVQDVSDGGLKFKFEAHTAS